LLFAGTSKIILKYSLYKKWFVTNFRIWRLSAGNLKIIKKSSKKLIFFNNLWSRKLNIKLGNFVSVFPKVNTVNYNLYSTLINYKKIIKGSSETIRKNYPTKIEIQYNQQLNFTCIPIKLI